MPIHINENLHNTRRIAETFRGFAGEYCKPRSSTGLLERRVQRGTEGARDMASKCVDALIREGWAPNQVALLPRGTGSLSIRNTWTEPP